MKHILITLFILSYLSSFSQTTNSPKLKFKTVGISFQNYAKPQLGNTLTLYVREKTFDNVKNNIGFSATYTQTNFIKNSGIEYGFGIDLMLINNEYNLSFQDSTHNLRYVKLTSLRTSVMTISAPIFYVHKIQLSERLTLFPKTGITARTMIHADKLSLGRNSETEKVSHNLSYTTDNDLGNFPFSFLLFTWSVGTSFGWELDNGNMIGADISFSTRLFHNHLVSKINNIVYEKDGVTLLDSKNYRPDHYINSSGEVIVNETSLGSHFAEHSLSNISIGISYKFIKQ